MSYMKRFLEDVANELGVDIMDQRVLDEANRRLDAMKSKQSSDPLDDWDLMPDQADAIDAAFARPPSVIKVTKLPVYPGE